jgi:CO dehydrogenase nickel-insertion accessory protein CooC1
VVTTAYRTGADIAPIKKFISDIGLEVFGTIPMDRTLEKFDMERKTAKRAFRR